MFYLICYNVFKEGNYMENRYDDFKKMITRRLEFGINLCEVEWSKPYVRERDLFLNKYTYFDQLKDYKFRLAHLDEILPYDSFDYVLSDIENIMFWSLPSRKYLEILRGKDPTLPETRDEVIRLVNKIYEINIPLTGEIELLQANWYNQSDEDFCRLRELQRDAGFLSGDSHNRDFLDINDDLYIEAKKRCGKKK